MSNYHPTPSWLKKPFSLGLQMQTIRLMVGGQGGKAGHRLKGLNIKFLDDEVLLVVKKDTPKGPMVAFFGAEDLEGAMYNLALAIKAKRIDWKPDKWGSMRNDGK